MVMLPPLWAVYCSLFAALLGLVFGSFCNAWAWRLCRGESIVRGHSHCAACGHPLAAKDLLPLLSFFLLRGRCRYCGAPISRRYPAVEALSAVFFVSVLWRVGLFDPLTLLRVLALGALLLTVSLVDWETQELPDGLLLAAGCLSLLRLPLEGWAGAKDMALGAVSISIPLLLIVLLADRLTGRETMGGGDIKLFFVLGLHLGPALTLMALLLACVLGIALALLLGRGKARGVVLPFGPAAALGTWFVLLGGQTALDWYLSLFF